MVRLHPCAAVVFVVALIIPTTGCESRESVAGTETAMLTSPPEVPAPITRRQPTKVVVHLETRELAARLADGVDYSYGPSAGRYPARSSGYGRATRSSSTSPTTPPAGIRTTSTSTRSPVPEAARRRRW
jgi:hypothetical protein